MSFESGVVNSKDQMSLPCSRSSSQSLTVPFGTLADEINRTTPRTQSALLEAMSERQVTADGTIYPLERPFFLIATQNPIEYEGTYPLPEAQLDRFLFKIVAGYPQKPQEVEILKAAKAAGNGWYLACLISRFTGLLYSSVARLTWREIDLASGVIRHTPPKTKRHGITVTVPLAKALHDELLAARSEYPDASHVLPLHEQSYQYRRSKSGPGLFSSILTAAKVTGDYTFHSWRHTFRTRLSEAGVSDDLAKRLGGWTVDATAARYDHAERVEELRAAVEKAK